MAWYETAVGPLSDLQHLGAIQAGRVIQKAWFTARSDQPGNSMLILLSPPWRQPKKTHPLSPRLYFEMVKACGW